MSQAPCGAVHQGWPAAGGWGCTCCGMQARATAAGRHAAVSLTQAPNASHASMRMGGSSCRGENCAADAPVQP
eukprot:5827929-Lingulodinium_polyedra.AAC.1